MHLLFFIFFFPFKRRFLRRDGTQVLVLKAFRRGFRAPGVGGFVNFLRRWGGSVISGILPTRHSGRGASTVGRGCNWARSERGWDAWVGIVLVSWRSGEFGGGFSILWEVEFPLAFYPPSASRVVASAGEGTSPFRSFRIVF